MTTLEQVKTRLEEYTKKEKELISSFIDKYDLHEIDFENFDLEEVIYNGPMAPTLQEHIQYDYLGGVVVCYKILVSHLERWGGNDDKSRRLLDLNLGGLVQTAREIQKRRAEEIQQAQNVIDILDDLIKICEENRE